MRAAREDPVGAFEVSKTRRELQVVTSVIYCLLGAGVVFGYAALKPVLIEEGVYKEYCTEKELDKGVRVCFEQELRLNFMFTAAAVATNVCALVVGAILDFYGPRVTGIIGSIFIGIGSLLFAYARKIDAFDAYVPGYLFLALGGPFIFIPSFQLSNAFPASSGLILSMLTGAFDSSSAVFLFYRLAYERWSHILSLRTFFLGYLVVPLFILVVQIFIMPPTSYKTVGELVKQVEEAEQRLAGEDRYADEDDDEYDDDEQLLRRERRESVVSEITSLLGSKGASRHQQKEETKREVSGVWGAMHGKSVYEQMLSPWYILILLFTIVQMTRINYFVATIRPQYEYLLGSVNKAILVNEFFDIALPVGGLCAVPFIGMLLDKTATPTVLLVLVGVASATGVLGLLRDIWAAYANVILFVLYRPFYYTAISDYTAKVFGFQTFGTIYGSIICVAGIFNFAQTGMDAATAKWFHHDPRPINLILLIFVSVIGGILWMWVTVKSKKLKRTLLEEEANRAMANENIMPGGYGGF
ncbi:MFS general substrate transporter [Terfezia boudieri ATCC MYA-4762]|uniref:MFS general substrate transporter n=1 Tax=Terfezia boudieri ATCC MYA-4762 TaxID=1051890 RepID=A0A3N4LK67_9PEZI|nr:MFS general substrate transporter [Terfezia boudieri ATCC MYA-4762]